MLRARLCAGLILAASVMVGTTAHAGGVVVVERSPAALMVRLAETNAGGLYRVIYDDGHHRFVWDNLSPDAGGMVRLADDKHLRPEYRLRCESRVSRTDPVVFDDLLKGAVVGKRRQPFGVPVSTFGGAGYLVPGLSDLKRDEFGNFWLYLDHAPYAVMKYDAQFDYQFALLTPGQVLAHDLDADGNLYVLHPDNWVSKHGPLGEPLGAWELPFGREPGEFVSASGLTVDREAGFVYIADEMLGRVQRFDLELRLRPLRQIAWGWIGREDLAHTEAGKYDLEGGTYYQLDRPRQVHVNNGGQLLVSCEYYISKFDLATGRQLSFGNSAVLGWGGTFTDSPFSTSAGLDGHWQRQWLVGTDASGNVYVSDRENEFATNPRLQVFSPEGVLLRTVDLEDEVRDESGRAVYVSAVRSMAAAQERIWVVDAAGRVYESREGLRSGGRLFLGPGAAGRQFDLSAVQEAKFKWTAQRGRVKHRSEGLVMAPAAAGGGTGNCEREGRPVLEAEARSMWIPSRLGEPFRVKFLDDRGVEMPPGEYEVELEENPGLFGSQYDFFRVTNRSDDAWHNVRFVAETVE